MKNNVCSNCEALSDSFEKAIYGSLGSTPYSEKSPIPLPNYIIDISNSGMALDGMTAKGLVSLKHPEGTVTLYLRTSGGYTLIGKGLESDLNNHLKSTLGNLFGDKYQLYKNVH